MKRYGNVEQTIVTKRECIELRCDLCGRIAENPNWESGPFEYCTVGTGKGSLKSTSSVDGDFDWQELDLCHECADWLIDEIRHHRITREQEDRL
ncbi:hypothetical protein LCGC14_0235420 [marine sediment metagenome]|uniref:Uncharacterized protein n=1 Tax=marine sediment metagenome TaxID=412755 RepID=A0A0F9WTQ2_9ZZZZ